MTTKCYQKGCEKPPTKIVYWPGLNPPPEYCDEDAQKAVEILKVMGINVVVVDINIPPVG